MSQELEFHKKEYANAVSLYLWYQDSKFSYFQGKANRAEMERYRYLAHYHFQEVQKMTAR